MDPGTYDYFEHQADMGIIGRGPTPEEAFAQAARAMFDLMVDVERVRPLHSIVIQCHGYDQGELLIEWLNHLLAEADIQRFCFSTFQVEKLTRDRLKGRAWGEPFDPQRHRPKTEVKAATYSMLFVGREEDQYVARCIVDL